MRALALLLLVGCNRSTTSTEASSNSAASVATALPSASVVATIALPSSAPSATASQAPTVHPRTISFAGFKSDTLTACVDISVKVLEKNLVAFEAEPKPKGTIKDPCAVAFEGRKVFGRCELDADATRKLLGTKPNPEALSEVLSSTMYLYRDEGSDASMRDCLEIGGRWKATPP
jgi:hypothetical protein